MKFALILLGALIVFAVIIYNRLIRSRNRVDSSGCEEPLSRAGSHLVAGVL